jgi:trimeric autotransporter adhesin
MLPLIRFLLENKTQNLKLLNPFIMKKTIQFVSVLTCLTMHFYSNAQIKVYTGGYVAVGSTSVTPNKPLDVIGSGGIRISQTTGSSSTNELYFQDNGQIRSLDDNHRIIFDRTNNIMKFREYGDISFYPGSAGTLAVTVTSGGDLNINGAAKSLQINSVKMLWNNNNAFDLFIGNSSGNGTMSGHKNTLVGNGTGTAITSGASNSYLGYHAGFVSTSGSFNTAMGHQALLGNTTGEGNTAIGLNALGAVTTGNYNIGIGYNGGVGITTGSSNVAIGYAAGLSNTTGGNNIYIGTNADANAGNYTNSSAIGNSTVVTASNKMFFGNSSITNIQGQVNFTTYSDGRFKTDVTENVKGLEFINKLRPVTYKMNTVALDDFIIQNMSDSLKTAHKLGLDFTPSMAMIHSGFIAQEVELAAQEVGFTSTIVSAPANATDPYALSYAEIVVPLVKAVQELSKKADSLETETAGLDSINAFKETQLQAMQNQITQLQTLIEACCASGRMQEQNNSDSELTNSTDILNTKNNIVLQQNKPNPFHDQTEIEYYIPANCTQSSIIIFDMQGKLMKTVILEQKEKGSIKINGGSLQPGMYMYSLIVDNKEVDTKRMILTE